MLDNNVLLELKNYIEKHLKIVSFAKYEAPILFNESVRENFCENIPTIELEDFIKNKRKPAFNQVLFSFIDKKGTSDSEVYKKAHIDRRHFSKIRSNPDYKLGKNAAIALALALELNKKETDSLLRAAGYSLSDSDISDLVILFCIEKKIYDIQEVNEALDYNGLKPLIGTVE